MLRDFSNLDLYLNQLMMDDYGQQPDKGHTAMIREVMEKWISTLSPRNSVLDVGCGAACIAEPFFRALGVEKYTGIALGLDVEHAKLRGKDVRLMDMTFLDFEDKSFDLIWARHVAEHSTMPLITLMEWHRVSKSWLCLIVPNPEYYGRTGLNHYSVLDKDHWEFLMERAGWHRIWEDFSNTTEFRFMCEKK